MHTRNEKIKLSIWSSYYVDLSPEDAVLEMKKHGFSYTELSDEHTEVLLSRGDPTEVGRDYGEFARENGVEILQGHLLLHAHITNPADRELVKRQIDLFCAIGIKNAVLHCDPLPEYTEEERRKANLAGLGDLIAAIGDRPICICLENLRLNLGCQSVDELLWYVSKLNSPHVGICLDTGHLNVSSASTQREFILRAGKHLRALHIADNEGESDQHLMPFGIGSVDMDEVCRSLFEIGYEGIWNLEIPGERKIPMEIRGFKLDYLKHAFAYLEEKNAI